MEKKISLGNPVKAIDIHNPKKISELLVEMKQTGFQGRKLGEVVDVWDEMIRDKDTTIILGYAGSLSTTGQWKIINWLIEKRYIDVLVSTGANISEDIVEAMGYPYLQGPHMANDKHVLESDYNRYYDVYGSETEYMKMTNMVADFMMTLDKNYRYTTREFLYLLGKWLGKKNINSIVATAAKHKVPVYCPAITDSPYGDAALLAKSKGHDFILDAIKDYHEFMGIADKVKGTGVIYIGGGVPKDFIQLLTVSSSLEHSGYKLPNRKEGALKQPSGETVYPHKYAIQITTDSPQWGGLSGCTFEEAISWGKIDEKGKYVQCYCDATIALPIATHALNERCKIERKGTDFNWLFKD